MNELLPIANKMDAISALIVAILSYFFGKYWYLFVGFLGLNILDYITGCIKSKLKRKTNSSKGAVGVVKKLGYWIMILLGFGMSAMFIKIGDIIGINLQVTSLLGWFVLASLIINEFRSIIENLVEAGYPVPEVLTKGLEVADGILEHTMDLDEQKKEETK